METPGWAAERVDRHVYVEHHGVQPTGCMDIELPVRLHNELISQQLALACHIQHHPCDILELISLSFDAF